jgi:2-dehydropantoate 2-reductase
MLFLSGIFFKVFPNSLNHTMPTNNIPSKSKIAIIGAGAVGSLIGALLARAGEHVTLIGRKEHVDYVNRYGLSVTRHNQTFSQSVHAAETLTEQPDIAILTVKMQDIEATCREYAPLLANSMVVTLQNGIRCDDIVRAVLGTTPIISGIVLLNAQFLKAGHVHEGSGGTIVLGDPFGSNANALAMAVSLLNKAVPASSIKNIHAARWTKLIMNCMNNALDAATGQSLNKCMNNPIMREIGINLLREAFAVLDAAGIRLVNLPGFNPHGLKEIVTLPMPQASLLLQERMNSILGHCIISSTLQSLRRRKPTEIDYLNAEFVREGKRNGVPTPFNRRIVEVIHTIEKTGVFYSPEELQKMFV